MVLGNTIKTYTFTTQNSHFSTLTYDCPRSQINGHSVPWRSCCSSFHESFSEVIHGKSLKMYSSGFIYDTPL